MRPSDAGSGTIWDRTIRGMPAVGAVAERTRTTTMRDVEMFTEMTGDRNPLHYDAALAAATPFGGLIVQGGVTSGLLNAVVAEDVPGPGTVFLGVEWRFVKAVKVGETITARVEVVSRQADLHPRDQRPQRRRRGVPHRNRDHLHHAAQGVGQRRSNGCAA
jgi:acyl dehydratase